jgi:hypothetical protein
MVAKNELVLLDEIIEARQAAGAAPVDVGDAFEQFGCEQALRSQDLSTEEIDATDVLLFCRRLHEARIGKGVIAALAGVQDERPTPDLVAEAEARYGLNLTVLVGTAELARVAVAWSNQELASPFRVFTPSELGASAKVPVL